MMWILAALAAAVSAGCWLNLRTSQPRTDDVAALAAAIRGEGR